MIGAGYSRLSGLYLSGGVYAHETLDGVSSSGIRLRMTAGTRSLKVDLGHQLSYGGVFGVSPRVAWLRPWEDPRALLGVELETQVLLTQTSLGVFADPSLEADYKRWTLSGERRQWVPELAFGAGLY